MPAFVAARRTFHLSCLPPSPPAQVYTENSTHKNNECKLVSDLLEIELNKLNIYNVCQKIWKYFVRRAKVLVLLFVAFAVSRAAEILEI